VTRRRVGSNQYHTRGHDDLESTGTDLMVHTMHVADEDRRCGEIWGTGCQAKVQAPDYSHGNHDLLGDAVIAARSPYCPPDILLRLANMDNDRVRQAIAENPACTATVLI